MAKYGHVKHADLLMKYGADLHAQNNAGNTPLHVAVSHGQVRMCFYSRLKNMVSLKNMTNRNS